MSNEIAKNNKVKGYFSKKHKVYPVAQTLKLVVVIAAIALFVDIQNYPSNLMDKFGIPSFSLGIATILAIVGITAYEDGLHKQLNLPFINRVDNLVSLGLYSSLVYLWALDVILGKELGVLNNGSIVILGILILYRIYKVDSNSNKLAAKLNSSIVYDFETVYGGKFSVPKGQRFIVNDNPSSEDLFGRDRLINHLESLIASGSSNDGCVISLQGKWGVGKTTLVKHVKKKVENKQDENDKKIIWIDEFDPWNYKDEAAMVTSLLDAIIKGTDIRYQSRYFNKAATTLANLILKIDSNVIDDILRRDVTLKDFKEQINDCLKAKDAKVVMVIDNLDRIDEEKLILIFDVIGNHLKFDNVTYLLLFDHERIEKVFEGRVHLGYEYVNKIINIPLTVPKLDSEKVQTVYGTALDNIFKAYHLDENIGEYDVLLDTMGTLEINPRNFKQFLNSGVIPFCAENYGLYLRDLIYLSFIKQFNYELYEKIYDNKNILIKFSQTKTKKGIKMKKTDDIWEIRQLFSDETYQKYNNIINAMFIDEKEESLNDIMKYKYICDERFFSLYFSYTDNNHLKLIQEVTNFIDKFNAELEEKHQETLIKLINKKDDNQRRQIINLIKINIESINNTYELFKCLWINIDKIYTPDLLVPLNEVINLFILILNTDNSILKDKCLKYSIDSDYKKIGLLIGIHNMGGSNYQSTTDKLRDKINTIYKDKINILSDKYYMHGNLWMLFNYAVADTGDWGSVKRQEDYKEYFAWLYENDKNIFKIVNEYIDVEIRHGKDIEYIYSINLKKMGELNELKIDKFNEDEIINKMRNKKSLDECENKIKNIFADMLEQIGNDYEMSSDYREIKQSTPINFIHENKNE